jgi:hypothetical protein
LRSEPVSDDILIPAVARKLKKPRTRKAAERAAATAWGVAQWNALRSPIRFELFTLAEGAAPCSISDLARLSGRRASGLYRHVDTLTRAKLLKPASKRRAGRRFETVYSLGPMARALSVGSDSQRAAKHLSDMVERAFRAASRDLQAALRFGHWPLHRDPATPLHFFFEVTWLDDHRRRALHRLMRSIADLVREGRAQRTGELHRIVSSYAPLVRGGATSRSR